MMKFWQLGDLGFYDLETLDFRYPGRRMTQRERENFVQQYWDNGGPNKFELAYILLLNEYRHSRGFHRLLMSKPLMEAARYYNHIKAYLGEPGHTVGSYQVSTNIPEYFSGYRSLMATSGGYNTFSFPSHPQLSLVGWITSPGHH